MLMGTSLTIFPLLIFDFQVVTCPHKDCYMKMTARDMAKHKEGCPFRMEQCHKDCCLLFPFHELEGHECFQALRDRVEGKCHTLHRHRTAETRFPGSFYVLGKVR